MRGLRAASYDLWRGLSPVSHIVFAQEMGHFFPPFLVSFPLLFASLLSYCTASNKMSSERCFFCDSLNSLFEKKILCMGSSGQEREGNDFLVDTQRIRYQRRLPEKERESEKSL